MSQSGAAAAGLETAIPAWRGETTWLFVEHGAPQVMRRTHWHNHIEINYLTGCTMTYQRGGGHTITLRPGQLTVFWASNPHRVTAVHGRGVSTCIYLSLQEFIRWNLPVRFCHEVMHGGFLSSLDDSGADDAQVARWRDDFRRERADQTFIRQALDEIRLRLRRIALSGWHNGERQRCPDTVAGARGPSHVETMATFIAARYRDPIGVGDVAGHVGLHPNYAMTLFKRAVGLPIAAYITRHRLSHAQTMLLSTDKKILTIALDCGFGSLSRFYDTFRATLEQTPRQYRNQWRR